LTFYNLNPIGEAVLPNVCQNGSNSTREATPPEEPEPEPFLEEPEPCQTGLIWQLPFVNQLLAFPIGSVLET
jgi:hypothetical protein